MGVKYDLRRESYMAVEIRREWYTLYTTFVCKCKTRAAYNTCRRTPIPYLLFRGGLTYICYRYQGFAKTFAKLSIWRMMVYSSFRLWYSLFKL